MLENTIQVSCVSLFSNYINLHLGYRPFIVSCPHSHLTLGGQG